MTRGHRISRLTITGLMALGSLAGCVSGSGNIVSEARQVGDFDSVEVSGGLQVELILEPQGTVGVVSTYDDNLQEKIRTEVVDGTLVVEASGNIDVTEPGRHVEITVDSLETLLVSGGAEVNGTGSASVLAVAVEGGATANLTDLVVGTMDITATAGATANVAVVTGISGEVTGGAELTVLGNPASRNLDVSDGGKVSN